jgi:hypothetical protein
MWPNSRTCIDLLHVQGANQQRLALRLALSHLLNTADLCPPGLSPSAVLIVRRMLDPLPGCLAPQRRPVRVDSTWEKAVQKALANILQRAAHPSQGHVPANAEAVVFADEGEMVACFAIDMTQGEAWARWWWRTILRALPDPASRGLTMVLCQQAASVPAALRYLALHGQAGAVVGALSPPQAMAVLSAIGRAYGISDFCLDASPLTPTFARRQTEAEEPDDWPVHPRSTLVSQHRDDLFRPSETTSWLTRTGFGPAETPLWPATLVPPGLGKERTCLLGVGLRLCEQPAIVHSSAFLRTLRHWWRQDTESTLRQVSPAAEATERMVERPTRDRTGTGGGPSASKASLPHTMIEAMTPPSHRFPQGIPQRADTNPLVGDEAEGLQGGGMENNPDAPLQQASTGESWTLQPRAEAARTSEAQSGKRAYQAEQAPALEADLERQTGATEQRALASQLEDGVPTALSGVFYLVNLMLRLDLPACFEEEWELASQVGSWGVLEALSRGLLTTESAHLSADPLWSALAQLGGRQLGQLPGDSLPGSDQYRLPVIWETHAVSTRSVVYYWYWTAQHRRLYMWTAGGYVLLDCPQSASSAEAQMRAALWAYQANPDAVSLEYRPFEQVPRDPLSSTLVEGVSPGFTRWLALALPYIRFRLQRALHPAADNARDVEEILLRCQGRLYVTSTHVDVVMRLQDISLPVRLAGLDRDPGWVAQFGRVIQFHFE